MEPEQSAVVDGDGKTYDTHMEYVIQNNPTLKREFNDMLSKQADVSFTQPVKNKDQSRVASTRPATAPQEPVHGVKKH